MSDETLDLTSSARLITVLGSSVAAGLITHSRNLTPEIRDMELKEFHGYAESLENAAANADNKHDREMLLMLSKSFRAAESLLQNVTEAKK